MPSEVEVEKELGPETFKLYQQVQLAFELAFTKKEMPITAIQKIRNALNREKKIPIPEWDKNENHIRNETLWDEIFARECNKIPIMVEGQKNLKNQKWFVRLKRAQLLEFSNATPTPEAQAKLNQERLVEKNGNILKKMQMYIEQYIQEIQALQTSGNCSEDEQTFWNRVILFLKRISKDFEIPTHENSVFIMNKVDELRNFNGVNFINSVVLKKVLDEPFNHQKGKLWTEDEKSKYKSIQEKLNNIKNKVLSKQGTLTPGKAEAAQAAAAQAAAAQAPVEKKQILRPSEEEPQAFYNVTRQKESKSVREEEDPENFTVHIHMPSPVTPAVVGAESSSSSSSSASSSSFSGSQRENKVAMEEEDLKKPIAPIAHIDMPAPVSPAQVARRRMPPKNPAVLRKAADAQAALTPEEKLNQNIQLQKVPQVITQDIKEIKIGVCVMPFDKTAINILRDHVKIAFEGKFPKKKLSEKVKTLIPKKKKNENLKSQQENEILWDTIFTQECNGIPVFADADPTEIEHLKISSKFVDLKNLQLRKFSNATPISAETKPLHTPSEHDQSPSEMRPTSAMRPTVASSKEDSGQYDGKHDVNTETGAVKKEKPANPTRYVDMGPPIVEVDAEEKARTLKKMQMYIKQYIQEIQEIQKEEKKTGKFSAESQRMWSDEIQHLKELSKDLANPDSKISKNCVTQLELGKKNWDLVKLLNTEYLREELNSFYYTPPQETLTIEEQADKDRIQTNLNNIQNKVAKHFFLTRPVAPGEQAPPHPEPVFKRAVRPEMPAQTTGSSAAFFLSRIAGTPKRTPMPEEHMERSVKKDLEKICELYTKEIQDLKGTAPTEKAAIKNALEILKTFALPTTFLTHYKPLIQAPKTGEHINNPNALDFTEAASEFVMTQLKLDTILSDENRLAVREKVSRKFLEASAPQKYQKIIKQANQHVEKLYSELEKLNMKINKHADNLKNPTVKELVKRRAALEDNFLFMDGLSKRLASGGEHTKPNFLAEMRNKKAIYVNASKQDKKYIDVVNLIEEILKVSDPYYDDIKKLDQYIENLNKDLKRNPPKENEDFSKNSNRQEKLKIAEQVRQRLLTLVELVNKGDKQYYRTVEDKSIIEFMNTARANNKVHTITFIGKGKLDGIIGDILNKLEPDPKRQSKP